MRNQTVKIADLLLDPANVRTHSERNLAAIKASLARFGQQKPIIVDGNGIVRAGNGTLEAARALGWETIKVVRTNLMGSEATAYAIADNRTSELAEWDQEALASTLEALKLEEIDLQDIGFSEEDLAALLAVSAQEAEELEAPEEFKSVDESIETEHCCPKCGYKWSGKPA
jgi:ParB-like chromosome segregation protein Spo0J